MLIQRLWRTRPTALIAVCRGKVFFNLFLQNAKHKIGTCPICLACKATLCSLQKSPRCQICELSIKTHQCISVLPYETEDRRGENNKDWKVSSLTLIVFHEHVVTPGRLINTKHNHILEKSQICEFQSAGIGNACLWLQLCSVFGFLHCLKTLKCFCSSTHWEYSRV